MADLLKLETVCRNLRKDILKSTTQAGSGHPSSCLSAVELMAGLFFGDILGKEDKVIFSKGHAAPLLYSIYKELGQISEKELLSLRQFNSNLEGHPTPRLLTPECSNGGQARLPMIDVATGSLGQGLSVGLGMALGFRLKFSNLKFPTSSIKLRGTSQISNSIRKLPYVFVLVGDSELAEGQNWEALAMASKCHVGNLIGILDVNRLGQTGETSLGWDIETYEKRISSFGWETIMVEDGNNLKQVISAYQDTLHSTAPVEKEASNSAGDDKNKPRMIIAKTIKGKGVPLLEDKEGWHGKVLNKQQLKEALEEIEIKSKVQSSKLPSASSGQAKLKSQKFDSKIKSDTDTKELEKEMMKKLESLFKN